MAWVQVYQPGIDAMLRSPEMVRAMRARAEAGRAFAQRIAPVDTGRYRASFRVVAGVRDGKAWARLENPVYYAVYLEWGTRYMRARRVLGRAADAMR